MSATLLVVDDDPAIVHLLKEYLEMEGYGVVEGFDGVTALRLAREKRPHLIVLDLYMPGMDGLKVFESLRSVPETKDIPILFLTGESCSRASPQLRDLPGVVLLEKPVELDRLLAVVRQCLEKHPPDRG